VSKNGVNTEVGVFCQSLQHFINEGQWKMILLCCLVEFSLINTHPPSYDGALWNKLIPSVLYYRHSSFLGNHLDRDNPITMWYGINDPGVKKLEDFLFHDFPHRVIKPALWFTRGCARRVDWNAMGTKSSTNPLEIFQGIPNDRPTFF